MSLHRSIMLAGILLGTSIIPANAHHSYSAFDLSREHQLRGEIVGFDWTSPHTITTVDVVIDGKVTRWQFEGMSPDYLGRRGWNRQSLVPGDPVTIDYYSRTDNQAGGLLIRVRLADGTVKVMIVTE